MRAILVVGTAPVGICERSKDEQREIDCRPVGFFFQWPLDDAMTFDLLRRGDTAGVYQLDTEAAQRYLREWKPTTINDIFILTACNRSGMEDHIPAIIAIRKGETAATFLHPLFEPVTAETYGHLIYQEQVIHTAHVLAGYMPEEWESLRRVLNRQNKDATGVERRKFEAACGRVNRITSDQADALFDTLEKFAGCTFCKAHAVAHGILTFQMTYLKAHHPEEFSA